jgi:hypothetical protein
VPLEQDKLNGFKVELDDQVNTGLWPDVFSTRIPMWETGQNIQFTEFGVEKVAGSRTLANTGNAEPIRGLLQNLVDDDPYLYAGDLSQLYQYNFRTEALTVVGNGFTMSDDVESAVWDSGATTWDGGVSRWDFGIAGADHWSMVSYGTFAMATNGLDLPQIQKGVDTQFVPVTGMDVTTVEVFAKRGPHVLGFNTSASPREFIWSDADNVDVWVAQTDNLAGQLEIRELKTDIVSAVPLGGRIAVYGSDQMFVVNYLGNDLVFGYQPAINGIGSVAKHGVVPVGRNNYGLSSQGFFATDGSTFEYIDDPALRHWWQHNINEGQIAKVIGYHDEENNQIRWYFPSDESTNTKAVSFNYKRNTWSFILGNRSAGTEREVARTPFTGTEDGRLLADGTGDNNDADPIDAYVISKPLDLGSADVVKELDSIRIGYRGTGITYRIGWSEYEDGPINWRNFVSMEQGFDFDNLRTAGRWLYLEIRTNTLNTSWEVMSVQFIGRTEGTR